MTNYNEKTYTSSQILQAASMHHQRYRRPTTCGRCEVFQSDMQMVHGYDRASTAARTKFAIYQDR